MLDIIEAKNCSNIIDKGISASLKTIDDVKLQKINEFMPEIHRTTTLFSKSNSQTTTSLMTLTMLEAGPYRTLRQILAQIEKKRLALKEAFYNREKSVIKIDEYDGKLFVENNDIKRRKMLLEKTKLEMDLRDSLSYIEATVKEIGAYQERYKEICKNNNIPEKWDEVDFEQAEIEHHIKCIFRNAIHDRMNNVCNNGTMEYAGQFGINPVVVYRLVDNYLSSVNKLIEEEKVPTINLEYEFLDKMYDTFKNEYKKVLKRIGLESTTYDEYLQKEVI